MDKPIEFKQQDGALRRLMVAFEAPCGDYGETEADERDATEADLIAALQANDELRAKVLRGLPREYWCPTCDAPGAEGAPDENEPSPTSLKRFQRTVR